MLFQETEWEIEVEIDEPQRKPTREMPATQLTYLNDQVRASIVRERNEQRRAQNAVQIIMPTKR